MGDVTGLVYKQAFIMVPRVIAVSAEELEEGIAWIDCEECSGTGVFLLPDDRGVPCNACKTKGKEPVNLW